MAAVDKRINPAVSVCIPTYNGEQYLAACLDSVLGQSFEDLDILIVDDASSDGTQAIVESYAARDGRIRFFRNEHNLGLVGNWNRCLDLASGTWIKFVFHDDWIAPTCLARMVAAGSADHTVLVVCGREFVYEAVSEEVRQEYVRIAESLSPIRAFPGRGAVSAAEFCSAVLEHGIRHSGIHNFLGEPTAMLIHRDAVARYGKFNPDLIQVCDLEYWLRIGINEGITCVPEVLARFRVHVTSTTMANASRRAYRKNVIDPLLLRHDFAYHPLYRGLRQSARQAGLDFRHEFMWRLVAAQADSKRLAKDANAPDSSQFEEWQRVIAAHPEMRIPWTMQARESLLRRLGPLRSALRRFVPRRSSHSREDHT